MKKPFYVALVAALALLSGCVFCQQDKTPPCVGLSDVAKTESVFRPKCLLSFGPMEYKKRVNGFGTELATYGNWKAGTVSERQRSAIFDALNESGLFAFCREDDARALSEEDVRIKVTCNYDYSEGFSGVLAIFSLGLVPGTFLSHEFSFAVLAVNGQGLEREYRFKETIDEKGGTLGILVMWSLGCGSAQEPVFVDMHRKIMNHALVKMQHDGFFSAEARDKAAAKAKVVEPVKKTVAGRRKELEDLKKAGIIDEAEYAAEVKKLEGAGK